MDSRLLEILVCPVCKGPLQKWQGGQAADGTALEAELHCPADHLAFPVRDGIPVMLEEEARRTAPEAPAGATDEPDAQ